MNATTSSIDQIIALTRQLLDSISQSDWATYQSLCDPTLTAFEPEALGQQVGGLAFHRFYFELGGHMGKHASTICSPHVRMLGDDAAVISYVRLVQQVDTAGSPRTTRCEETRIWQRRDGAWQHVHFHRSVPG